MKRFISVFISMLVFISSISANAKEKLYDYDYRTKTLTINIQGAMKEYELGAPWEDIEYPENIVFKEGLTSIPSNGFAFQVHGEDGTRYNNYDRIKTVKLPSTIKSIGEDSFSYCKKLQKINLHNGIKKIGICAFQSCDSLKQITIPGSVSVLSYGTFEMCERLKKVYIMNGVKKINQDAFWGCHKLKNLTLSDTVIKIGECSFGHCYALDKIDFPKKLKSIYPYAFYSCKNLKKVTIQNKVTVIHKLAFSNCIKLKDITIPKSVKTIGKKAIGYKEKEVNHLIYDKRMKGVVIRGYKGTAAEKYAKKNKFKFVPLD